MAYRKSTQPSIFTVGFQLSRPGSLVPGTTKNWFPSQNLNCHYHRTSPCRGRVAWMGQDTIPRLWYAARRSLMAGNHPSCSLRAQELGDRFGPGADVKLGIDVADVRVNGLKRDRERIGYFLVHVTFGQQPEDFPFARR